LLRQGWKLCLSSENARRSYGLPFKDFESQTSTNLLKLAIVNWAYEEDIPLLGTPRKGPADGTRADRDPARGCFE
jgi:hypothetical protein